MEEETKQLTNNSGINYNDIKEAENIDNIDQNVAKEESINKEEEEDSEYIYENRLQIPYIEKEKGDKELKIKNYEEALRHYSKVQLAMKVLAEEKAINQEQLKKYVEEVSIPTHLNQSFIMFQKGNWDYVIKFTSKILTIQPDNIKARYRKAMALLKMGKYTEAKEDIDYLKDKIGDTKEYDVLLKAYEEKIEINKQRRSNFYTKISKSLAGNLNDSNNSNSSHNKKGILSNLYIFFSKINIFNSCCKKKKMK